MGYLPILSILTALFEIIAAVWALRGPGRKSIVYASSAILFLLAIYQILEVIVCTAPLAANFYPKLAFISITWLPPTGLLLIALLYTSKTRAVYGYVRSMFVLALLMVFWVLLDKHFVSDSVCTIVFARYLNPTSKYLIYSGFYWLGLLGMIILSAYGVKIFHDPNRLLLRQILIGSIAFIAPSLITVLIIPPTKGALPSIMCHYALLLAIFITRLIVLERRHARQLQETPP